MGKCIVRKNYKMFTNLMWPFNFNNILRAYIHVYIDINNKETNMTNTALISKKQQ